MGHTTYIIRTIDLKSILNPFPHSQGDNMTDPRTLSRRTFLSLTGIATAGALAACVLPETADSGDMGAMAEPVTIRYGRHDRPPA